LSAAPFTRRAALLGAASFFAAAPRARAFGSSGAFQARLLSTGGSRFGGLRETAPARWGWELMRRTSAPARLGSLELAADAPGLLAEPFVIWAGSSDVAPLGPTELRGLERYLALGGALVVDDAEPGSGAFGRAARRELARVLPSSAPVALSPSHVLFKTYYILDRPVGRVLGEPSLDAIVRGGQAQVLFLGHDLLGALARTPSGSWALDVEPGGERQREYAARLAVNIAMYLLCSDYKDDQVHAPWLMRRRASRR
jgi:hypothetical protein